MKKILFFAGFLLFSLSGIAQNVKFGHISPEEIMEMIPGFDTAQTMMIDFQNELQAEGQEMVREFQMKQQEYENKYLNASDAIKRVKEEEIKAMYNRIQEFSVSMDESLQKKKYELLLPFQTKILNAISEVAKEEKFTYIFNKAILSYYDQGIDITEKVKKKLNISDSK